MDRYCPEPKREEGGNFGQVGEDDKIQLNLAYEYTYNDLEGFKLFQIRVEEPNDASGTINSNSTGINSLILEGTEK